MVHQEEWGGAGYIRTPCFSEPKSYPRGETEQVDHFFFHEFLKVNSGWYDERVPLEISV
jgi:hypothetical protein